MRTDTYNRSPIPARDLLADRPEDSADIIRTQAAKGRLELDAQGRLIGVHGLTLRSTRHRVEHAGRPHHTWCAFDSIGIPAALHLDATARTTCPACGRDLAIQFTAGTSAPSEFALWLPAAPASHLMNEFCASADLYWSREHLERRLDVGATPRSISDVDAAAELGRDVWADVASLGLA